MEHPRGRMGIQPPRTPPHPPPRKKKHWEKKKKVKMGMNPLGEFIHTSQTPPPCSQYTIMHNPQHSSNPRDSGVVAPHCVYTKYPPSPSPIPQLPKSVPNPSEYGSYYHGRITGPNNPPHPLFPYPPSLIPSPSSLLSHPIPSRGAQKKRPNLPMSTRPSAAKFG